MYYKKSSNINIIIAAARPYIKLPFIRETINIYLISLYLFKMNGMFFANLKDLSFILFLFSLKMIHFRNVKLELLAFSMYANNRLSGQHKFTHFGLCQWPWLLMVIDNVFD